jgi:hypothetical protein
MMEEYIRHPESKSLGPEGESCAAGTRGLLQRAHITAGQIRYIDKETSSMWAQGDDLGVISDDDEIGFRVVEYGKSRKVVLPDSLKHEIQEARLQRELRRRGVGQHTLEKALHGHVRVNTYRKIVAAIEESSKAHDEFDTESLTVLGVCYQRISVEPFREPAGSEASAKGPPRRR